MEFKFKGFIQLDCTEIFTAIKLIDGDKSIDIVKKFKAIFDLFESEVSVSYFISDDKKTEVEIQEGWLKQMFGCINAEYETTSYNYSSASYGEYYDTILKIGGHDFFNELLELTNKWCFLKVNVKCV
jgi:hypothetical protein